MEQEKLMTAKEYQNQQILEAGLSTADCYINRSFLVNLDKKPAIAIDENLCNDTHLRFYHINRFVYDKKENVNDKMISVYNALHELNSTALLLVYGNETGVDYYLGVYSQKQAALCGDLLNKGLHGNFPGSNSTLIKTSAVASLLDTCIGDTERPKNVSAVSIIPSMRDKEKEKFVQGIEKFVDTMQGESYTALFIASPIDKTDLQYRKHGLEELASSLSPFVKSSVAYGENYSKAVSDGMCENFSKSVNHSISNSTGKNISSSSSDTAGTSSGMSLGGFNRGRNRSRTSGFTSGTNWSKAVTEGTADTDSKGTNHSDTVTTGDNRTLTIEHINKSVENLLKNVDDQLQRIRDCESFGLWDCAAYFLSDKIQVSVMAANSYKALVAGDTTYVENSYINVWNIENEYRNNVLKALRYGMHPHFLISEGKENGFDSQAVTPGSFISGKELPLFMGVPQKSVSGLTVNSIAAFSRGVFTLDNQHGKGNLALGHIFHMGKEEKEQVMLDIDSLTSHCFISGSTGSGKSNTSYVLLNALHQRNIPFLVIEPAKGEYKEEFANLPGIHIFSTNPRFGQMLHLNPFWFDADEIHVLEHLDRLIEIFNACWEMYAAMPAILKAGMERIYTDKGWDLLNSVYLGSGKPKFPTFTDLLNVLPEVIGTSGYSADTQGDYTGALVTRVASLANGISGQIFCSGNAIPDSVLFDETTIIDLSRVGSTETKSLIMGLLVMKLTEYRTAKADGSNSKLRHVTVLEEAHNLLKRTATGQGQETANLVGKSVEMISNSIAEMRTYGEGFMIIDQSPTAVDISAIKNTNTKIIMRLPEKSDCEAVGNAMALNEDQVRELAKLPTGVAAVIQNNWIEAALVKVSRAENLYHGKVSIVSPAELAKIRGAATAEIMHQYFNDRCFDEEKLYKAVSAVNGNEQKKQEILEDSLALIRQVGRNRDIQLISQGLFELSGCKSLFAIHENMLKQVDSQNYYAEDIKQLRNWNESVTKSARSVLHMEPALYPFLIRLLIFAKAQEKGEEKYLSYYEAIYEPERIEIHTDNSKEPKKSLEETNRTIF